MENVILLHIFGVQALVRDFQPLGFRLFGVFGVFGAGSKFGIRQQIGAWLILKESYSSRFCQFVKKEFILLLLLVLL